MAKETVGQEFLLTTFTIIRFEHVIYLYRSSLTRFPGSR